MRKVFWFGLGMLAGAAVILARPRRRRPEAVEDAEIAERGASPEWSLARVEQLTGALGGGGDAAGELTEPIRTGAERVAQLAQKTTALERLSARAAGLLEEAGKIIATPRPGFGEIFADTLRRLPLEIAHGEDDSPHADRLT